MNITKKIEDVLYPSPYWWNSSVNPCANLENGLANCVAFVYGECVRNGMKIVDKISNASNFHKHLINGWYSVPYKEYKANIKVGDVLEWEDKNHVAIVSDINDIWVSASFYTGINGYSYRDGQYDTRKGINSLEQLNDFMYEKYPYRMFHNVPLEEECSSCGGEPDYVLVAPKSIMPTERDLSKNQVYVGIQGLRVRVEPNTESAIRGTCPNGYFNVSEIVVGGDHENGNKWYKIDNLYIADIVGVTYYKKEELSPMDEMFALMNTMQEEYRKVCNERDEYRKKLELIRGVIDE